MVRRPRSDEHAAARAAQIAYVDLLLERTGWSKSKLAAAAGEHDTKLTRFYKPGNFSVLPIPFLRQLARVTGVPAPPSLLGDDAGVTGFGETEGAPYLLNSGDDAMDRAIRAALAGRNGVDPWVLRTRAIELEGFRPGDILLIDLNGEARTGDIVVAQLYAFPHFRAETVFRRFDGRYLVTATLDRSIDDRVLEPSDTVVIKGVMEGMIRKRIVSRETVRR